MTNPRSIRRSALLAALAAAAMLSADPALCQDGKADAKLIDAGEAVYSNYCETCHGSRMVNIGQSSFDLRRLRRDERARFDNAIQNGKGQMPPWKGVLDNAEVDAVWAYIRSNANDR